jgi:hypothetical protein
VNYGFFNRIVQPAFATLLNGGLPHEDELVAIDLKPVTVQPEARLRGASDWARNVTSSQRMAICVALKDSILRHDPLDASVHHFTERTRFPLNKKLVEWSVPITRWLAGNPDSAVPGIKHLADYLRHGPRDGRSSAHTVSAIALNWIGESEGIYNKASRALDINQEFLEAAWRPGQPNFDNRDPIIDLRGSEREKNLAELLQAFVYGNEGRVVFQRLEFNLSDYTVNAQFSLEHRHLWNSASELLGFVDQSVQNQIDGVVAQVESQLEQVDPNEADGSVH